MARQDPPRGLAGPGPQLQDPRHVLHIGVLGHEVLKLVVGGELGMHEIQVIVWGEVELTHHPRIFLRGFHRGLVD